MNGDKEFQLGAENESLTITDPAPASAFPNASLYGWD
jgi:hypothetical protein